jgi:Apea-like HEPN
VKCTSTYSATLFRSEDQILDLVIAAEALFGAGETHEVGYKVHLRAAAFLGSDAASRQRAFEEFKAAYDARSLIAHGGTPTKKQKQQIDKLPELINVIDGHVRAAIQKGFNLPEWLSTHSAWDTAVLTSLGSLTFT